MMCTDVSRLPPIPPFPVTADVSGWLLKSFFLSTWSSSCFTRFTSGSGREGFLHRLQLVQNAQRRWGMITSPPVLTSQHWLLKFRTDLITFYCSFLNGHTPAYISSLLTCYVPFDSWDLQMEPCSRSLCVTQGLLGYIKPPASFKTRLFVRAFGNIYIFIWTVFIPTYWAIVIVVSFDLLSAHVSWPYFPWPWFIYFFIWFVVLSLQQEGSWVPTHQPAEAFLRLGSLLSWPRALLCGVCMSSLCLLSVFVFCKARWFVHC